MGKQWQTLFWGAPKSPQMETAVMKLKDPCPLEENIWPTSMALLKSRDVTLPTKVRLVKAMVFSSSYVWMWNLDYKEGWAPKNGCFWTVVLEKTLESPLDCKEIQPVHPKGNQSWVFMERLMLKLNFQYFGHLMWRADSFEKTLMLGKTEGRKRRDNRGWDGWMASPTQRTWVWVSSGSWWWTGKPVALQSMGSQRVGHDWVTELNWYATKKKKFLWKCSSLNCFLIPYWLIFHFPIFTDINFVNEILGWISK